jgi:galactonate dehydratase
MKIESVESLPIGGAHFVRLTTDSGLVGIGQSACWAYPAAVHGVLESFRPYLVGQDPLRIEHHWQHLYRMGPFRGSVLSGAVSAVDIALWDIKGQHYGAPIWDLLGGKCRERIRLHLLLLGDLTPDEVAMAVKDGVAQGFTAVKFDPIPAGFADMSLEALVRAVEARVAAARDAAGQDADLLIELHRKLTPLQTLPVIEVIAKFRPLAIEDPIQIDSIVSQAEIARRVSAPIAYGERLHTIWEFRELLAYGGSQYVRPDLGLAGGLTHCKKIAAIAEAYHAAVVTHNFLGPVLTAASAHLDIAIPNFVVQEYSLIDESEAAAFPGALRRAGGYLPVPEAPGLGVCLDESKLGSLAPLGRPLHQIPLRADGSVVYAV